ncbi:MAG: type I pullulanase [Calditrichia bacterium]
MRLWFLVLSVLLFQAQIINAFPVQIEDASLSNWQEITVQFSKHSNVPPRDSISIIPQIPIERIEKQNSTLKIYTSFPFQLDRHYFLKLYQTEYFLRPDGILDQLYSDKPLGYRLMGESIEFSVFAPRAKWVRVVLFDSHDAPPIEEHLMTKDRDGVWQLSLPYSPEFKYYAYRIWGPQGQGEMFDSTLTIADPYSPAVSTLNHYTHPGRTLILPPDDFDWEGDTWIRRNARDLIIYEMHIRDMTAHPSSGVAKQMRGSYLGLVEKNQQGGLPYLKKLGVNAVELLPAQDFGNWEVPYKDKSAPVYNTWNPYARNHWGYMTSYFFAPESYYCSGGTMQPGQYSGMDGRQVREFKTMVREFHRNGIAVLMDVVYNHASQYDYNPLKYIDKFYYFRLNKDCSFTSVSGCGNDIKTERPMTRRLIVDSVIHWMKEYHVDGFRFDLAKMIDWETVDAIKRAAREVNPQVVLIAEPWGGGYDPNGFSDHDWASWNDQIRNGVKGQNPHNGLGFIFGQWQGQNNRQTLQRYVMGSLRTFGGQYLKSAHSVNYLESHDDHTLGDFIRIGLGLASEDQPVPNTDAYHTLTDEQLRLHKLGAFFLMTSQGPVMIHAGQEFGRSKVIAPQNLPDIKPFYIDHNSYNKDDATNYINYHHAALNQPLVNFYSQLIQFRKEHLAFRHSAPEQFTFIPTSDSLLLAYQIKNNGKTYLVAMNGNRRHSRQLELPKGTWKEVLSTSSDKGVGKTYQRIITVDPSQAFVLLKE